MTVPPSALRVEGTMLPAVRDIRKRAKSCLSELALNAPEPNTHRTEEVHSFTRRRPRRLSASTAKDARLDVESNDEVAPAVVHPFSEQRFYWDVVILVWMAYSAVMLPLQASRLVPSDDS